MSGLKMNNGFYPALGTPTDSNGILNETSFAKGIELMVSSGASGVLCMGTMGIMSCIRNSEYSKTASLCVNTIAERIPVMVGVMDCSVNRVLDRIDALNDLKIDGVVATAPYYFRLGAGEIVSFFTKLSKESKYPVYIYDLPSVTQSPISIDILKPLMKLQNIAGIKSANLNMILDMRRNNLIRDDFEILYSGLDSFDVAIKSGIKRNLDGMYTCTPYNSRKMYEDFESEDDQKISHHLNNILKLRNILLKGEIFSAYSYAMQLVGCSGNYYPDYDSPVSEVLKEEIFECMKSIKEI
jgi:dihydrodipicolinate synthase/N-acetylneuraminate lyase